LKNNRYRFNISQEGNCEGKVLWSEKLIKDDAYKEIEQLPPVIPTPKEKTAIWVGIDQEPHEDYECNKCGYIVSTFTANIEPHTEYKYCPNCGARMVEPQESEDKE